MGCRKKRNRLRRILFNKFINERCDKMREIMQEVFALYANLLHQEFISLLEALLCKNPV